MHLYKIKGTVSIITVPFVFRLQRLYSFRRGEVNTMYPAGNGLLIDSEELT